MTREVTTIATEEFSAQIVEYCKTLTKKGPIEIGEDDDGAAMFFVDGDFLCCSFEVDDTDSIISSLRTKEKENLWDAFIEEYLDDPIRTGLAVELLKRSGMGVKVICTGKETGESVSFTITPEMIQSIESPSFWTRFRRAFSSTK